MKKIYATLAGILLLTAATGVLAHAETIAKSEPYDARVELPKTASADAVPVLTSDFEEDETVEYKGK